MFGEIRDNIKEILENLKNGLKNIKKKDAAQSLFTQAKVDINKIRFDFMQDFKGNTIDKRNALRIIDYYINNALQNIKELAAAV